jgi:hypothetical protein
VNQAPVSSGFLATFSIVLIAAACSPKPSGSCATPQLVVSPTNVVAGSPVTITVQGSVYCQGELVVPTDGGVVELSLAEPGSFPTSEPFSTPSAVVSDWATLLITSTARRVQPRTVAQVPASLEPGTYVAFVSDSFLIASEPFTVS